MEAEKYEQKMSRKYGASKGIETYSSLSKEQP